MSSESFAEAHPARVFAAPATRPLTIIFLTITFDPEPGAQHGLPLAKWMAKQGHHVKVLTTFPQYPAGRTYPGYTQKLRQWEDVEGIPVLRVPMYPSHDTSALRRIATYMSFMASSTLIGAPLVGAADVVFLYEPPPTNGIASLALKAFRGTPIVHHIADMWPETVIESGMIRNEGLKKIANTLIGGYCKFLYDQAHHVTVLSPGFKRLLVERGVPASKVSVIYNWADDAFRPLPRDLALQRELKMEGHFNFVYAGNIGPLQNIEALVRAAALLKDQPQIQVNVIGTGPLEAQVHKVAAELGVTNVNFVARRPYTEMPRIQSLADVLLVQLRDFPFLRATIPSKTQVSMACGRPVLLAAEGDAADLVRRAGAGVVCAPDDPRALADAMLRMYQMPAGEREAMGKSGRSYYERNLSLDASGQAMESLFLGAASQKG